MIWISRMSYIFIMHVSIGTFRLEPSLLSLAVKFSEHTQSEFSLHSPLKHHDSSDIRIRDSFTTLRTSFTSCTFYLKRSPVLNTFHLYLLSLFLIFPETTVQHFIFFIRQTDAVIEKCFLSGCEGVTRCRHKLR